MKIWHSQNQLRKLFNMATPLWASGVIIGSLFKILHWAIWTTYGGLLLAIGLINRSIILLNYALTVADEYELVM